MKMSRLSHINEAYAALESFAQERQTQFIFIADLSGSTEYKCSIVQHGHSNNLWLMRQLVFLQQTADHIRNYNAKIIKTLGDGVMASFDFSESPTDIVCCGVELLMLFRKSKFFEGKDKIEARISLDYGETVNGGIIDNFYDPVGLCVDRCARLNGQAGPGEIALSSEFHSQMRAQDKGIIHPSIKVIKKFEADLKGIGKYIYYRVLIL